MMEKSAQDCLEEIKKIQAKRWCSEAKSAIDLCTLQALAGFEIHFTLDEASLWERVGQQEYEISNLFRIQIQELGLPEKETEALRVTVRDHIQKLDNDLLQELRPGVYEMMPHVILRETLK